MSSLEKDKIRKVSIGCGWKYDGSTFESVLWDDKQKEDEKYKISQYDEFIGVDKGDYGQHHKRDIRRGLPFDNSSVDLIVADNILEHIPQNESFGEDDYIFVMNECLRVLKIGGKMKIVVPYWSSMTSAKDPTHYRMFAEVTFSYMEVDHPWDYGFKKGWKVLSSHRSEKRPEIIYAELEKVKDVK